MTWLVLYGQVQHAAASHFVHVYVCLWQYVCYMPTFLCGQECKCVILQTDVLCSALLSLDQVHHPFKKRAAKKLVREGTNLSVGKVERHARARENIRRGRRGDTGPLCSFFSVVLGSPMSDKAREREGRPLSPEGWG